MELYGDASVQIEIFQILKSARLFSVLAHDILAHLAGTGQWIRLEKGGVLFRRGDRAAAVYVVVQGELDVSVDLGAADATSKEKIVGRIRPNEVVGEIQMLTLGRRTATVTAATNCRLVEIPVSAFDKISLETPEFMSSLSGLIRKRLFVDRLAGALPRLFGSLSRENIEALIQKAQWVSLNRGDILMRKGEPGDGFYILIDGRMAAGINTRDNEGDTWDTVSPILRGESIGELALLTEDTRSATVFALRDSELVKFSRADFFELLEQYPKLLMQITRMIIGRMKKTMGPAGPRRECTVFALVPAGPDADVKGLLPKLCRALSVEGATACIDSQTAEEAMGTPGISQIPVQDPNNLRLSAWLNLHEERHQFVLLAADPGPTQWTRRCIRQADQVLVVARAGPHPTPGLLEDLLPGDAGSPAGVEKRLILLHPDGSRSPENTRAWLERLKPVMHHHVRMDREQDIQRLARFLAGTAVGVALSGGGARGFAHIGALKAMQEAGIPVDIVCGTSMGAIIAAQFALEWDFETLVEKNAAFCEANSLLFDLTLPIVSLFSGRVLVRQLKGFLGDHCIENLWVPYFCVSSNLTRAEITLHCQGLLRRAVQASNAAPGIFPPVLQGRDLLVDGAFLSNLPAGSLKSLYKGRVIALDVCPPVDLDGDFRYDEAVSGWQVLAQKLNPFSRKIATPSIMTILRRSGELASIAGQKRTIHQVADRYLSIPVDRYGFQDYKAVRSIIEKGYAYVKAQLAESPWK